MEECFETVKPVYGLHLVVKCDQNGQHSIEYVNYVALNLEKDKIKIIKIKPPAENLAKLDTGGLAILGSLGSDEQKAKIDDKKEVKR